MTLPVCSVESDMIVYLCCCVRRESARSDGRARPASGSRDESRLEKPLIITGFCSAREPRSVRYGKPAHDGSRTLRIQPHQSDQTVLRIQRPTQRQRLLARQVQALAVAKSPGLLGIEMQRRQGAEARLDRQQQAIECRRSVGGGDLLKAFQR